MGRSSLARCMAARLLSRPIVGLPSFTPRFRAACKASPGALRDHAPFLLGQRRVDMEQERIGVGTKLGDDKRHPVCHQAGNECTLRDSRSSLATQTAGSCLRAALSAAASLGRRSRASAPLPVSISVNSPMILETLILGKASHGLLLRFKAKARATLFLGADPVVSNQDFMHITITYVPSYICDIQQRLSIKTH